jgi:hypothetical protein
MDGVCLISRVFVAILARDIVVMVPIMIQKQASSKFFKYQHIPFAGTGIVRNKK